MRTFIRVISGKLRGRKVGCVVTEDLRPTPQRVREAFFSIMGNAIPNRVFVDIFAGTGVIGIEALSRGASATYFVERDPQFAKDIEAHLRKFDLTRSTKMFRTDAYRWIAAWHAPKEPVNVFLSPPFIDLGSKTDDLVNALKILQSKVAEDSLIILQTETGSPLDDLEFLKTWELRRYGRNELLIWQRDITPSPSPSPAMSEAIGGGPSTKFMTEREFAISVVKTLQDAGHQALWAGGCVRDELLGLTPKDFDIATDARPEQVQERFRRTLAIGASFGVVEVLGPRVNQKHLVVQVATFRTDGGYSDGRRPDEVVFSSAQEDALRRDFTVNGMFYDPIKGELHDYVGGQADLHARILRAIGDPAVRFQEDKLRLLRAVRIATRFELTIEPATESAIRAMARQLPVVSAERIAEELRQLFVHPRRTRGLNLLLDLGLAESILPELLPMKGLPQGPPSQPTGDLWTHVMNVLDFIGPKPSFPLAMATLLHDIGKPRVAARTPDRYTFYHHEHVGARLADEIALRLKLSNDERDRIVWLVDKHQYLADAPKMRLSKLKVILNHPGIHELLVLHRADALATGKNVEHVEFCERLLREWTADDLNPHALITGYDLMKMGIEQGPFYKTLLDAVREAQLDGAIRTREEALELVRRLMAEKGNA